MAQSLANVVIHLIWSVKDRRPLIEDGVRDGLHRYMAGTLQNLESPALVINSMPDHVHVLCQLARTLAISKLVEEVKKNSSKWMKQQGVGAFAWQNGYGVFSVSQSNVETVRRYLERQVEHHKRRDFKDEFRAFCKRHNVPMDERYVWD